MTAGKGSVVGALAGVALVVALGAFGVVPVFSATVAGEVGYLAAGALLGASLGDCVEAQMSGHAAREQDRQRARVHPEGGGGVELNTAHQR